MNLRRQVCLHVAVTVAVLGLSAALGLVLGPDEFGHYHESGAGLLAHSHVQAGPHRHDGQQDHPAPTAPPPASDEDGPAGRYVPSAGVVVAHRAFVICSTGAPECGERFTAVPAAAPRCLHVDPAISPRGPPA